MSSGQEVGILWSGDRIRLRLNRLLLSVSTLQVHAVLQSTCLALLSAQRVFHGVERSTCSAAHSNGPDEFLATVDSDKSIEYRNG